MSLRAVFYKLFFAPDDMSDRDTMVMSSIQKWKAHHRFPFKIIIQSLVLMLVILQVYLINTQFTEVTRANRNAFIAYFLPEDYTNDDPSSHIMYKMEELLTQLNKTVTAYYSENEESVTIFQIPMRDGKPEPIMLEVESFVVNSTGSTHTLGSAVVQSTYNLTLADPFGPFAGSDTEVKLAFFSLHKMKLTLSMMDSANVDELGVVDFVWNIAINYHSEGSSIQFKMSVEKVLFGNSFTSSSWINVFLTTFAIISFFLSGKALFANAIIYWRTKARWEALKPEQIAFQFSKRKITPVVTLWSDLPTSIKAAFIAYWHLVSMSGDLLIIISSIISVPTNFAPTAKLARLFLGLGCLMLCLNITKYLEYNLAFYTLMLTLRYSMGKVFRFVLGIMPLFCGYCFCGVAIFSPYSENFQDFGKTMVTLFALLNGDDIHAVFDDLAHNYSYLLVGRVYLYTFILLFITAVLNVFIFMVEDGYHWAKVLSSESINDLSKKTADHDSLLLWKILRRKLDIAKLFDILEEAERDLNGTVLPGVVSNPDYSIQEKPRYGTSGPSRPTGPAEAVPLHPATEKPVPRRADSPQLRVDSPSQKRIDSPQRSKSTQRLRKALSTTRSQATSMANTPGLASGSVSLNSKERAMEMLAQRQANWMTELTKKIEKSQKKFLDHVASDLDRMFVGDYAESYNEFADVDESFSIYDSGENESGSADELPSERTEREGTPAGQRLRGRDDYRNMVNLL